jgi:outer membrane biosynthesis protein TonB
MRTLRTLGLFLAVLAAATSARADDTKPPNISDVKAAVKGSSVAIEAKITDDTGVLSAIVYYRKGGGKWEEARMAKNEYDDVFKVSFSGGGDTEYYIQATDLLGNGPAAYGAQTKPMALGGGKGKKAPKEEVAKQEEPPPPPPEPVAKVEKPKREPRPPPEPRQPKPSKTASAAMAPPLITHRKPSVSPLEGQEFTLRVKISAEGGVGTAAAYVRPLGGEKTVTIPLTPKGDEQYIAVIPAALAKGTIEYLLAAKDGKSQQTNQGDGSPDTWYRLEFKAAAARPAEPGMFTIAAGGLTRAEPRKPIVLRAQITPGNLDAVTDDNAAAAEASVKGLTVMLLWREKDGEDMSSPMNPDPSGGLGGYGVSLEPQFDGTVIYYQVAACNADASKCAIDTGSKRKWNPLVVSATPADAPPPLEAVSKKAPASAPE